MFTRRSRRYRLRSPIRLHRLSCEKLGQRHLLATFVVNSTGAEDDSFFGDGICDTANDPAADPPVPPSGICTLKAAAEQANGMDGFHRIEFSVPGSDVPVFDLPGSVGFKGSIDGSTQPGAGEVKFMFALLSILSDGGVVRGITIPGRVSVVGNDNAISDLTAEKLTVEGSRNTIGGTTAEDAVFVFNELGLFGEANKVFGSTVGFNTISSEPEPSTITVEGTSNQIGGPTAGQGNTIHGQIRLSRAVSEPIQGAANLIQGNKIGFTPTGEALGGAPDIGILVQSISGNKIGGDQSGEGNVIAGFPTAIHLDEGSDNTIVQGNLIGTNLEGDAMAAPTQGFGVFISGGGRPEFTPDNILIGGTTPLSRNVISGFNQAGIHIRVGANHVTVDGNLIGLNAAGTAAIPNTIGVDVFHAPDNTIGGEAGNTISGNGRGIVIGGSLADGNIIIGNRIGTSADGTSAIGNKEGILVNGAPNTSIGVIPNTGAILGNLISGNVADIPNNLFGHGIFVANSDSTSTMIQGNLIGTTADGMGDLGNAGDGIIIVDADDTQIGGLETNQRNIVSGNDGDGITIFGGGITSGVNGTVIEGNYIGVDILGTGKIANTHQGIHIDTKVSDVRVGGESPSARNIISGNGANGILLFGAAAGDNEIFGNYIGVDKTGLAKIPNDANGISIQNSQRTIIGKRIGTGHVPNVISGNKGHGVFIQGQSAQGNILEGNLIGVGPVGNEQLGNNGSGVYIEDAPNNRVGPYASKTVSAILPNGANIISDNFNNGIVITGVNATGNHILGNGIGTDGNGQFDAPINVLGNLDNGVLIIGAANNFIGGKPTTAIPATATIPETPAANVIGGNVLDGVRIEGATATGNRILNNSIYQNGSEGIDLLPAGITDNDPAGPGNTPPPDNDEGPNRLQNYPLIQELQRSTDGRTVRLVSRLESTPETQFTIQVFSNVKREQAGQGQNLLMEQTVTTNNLGIIDFNVDVPTPQAVGGVRAAFFAMTATDPNRNTSEFSPSATAPELIVSPFELQVDDIPFESGRFIYRGSVEVRNEGGRDAQVVLVQFRDQDGETLNPVDNDQFVDLTSGDRQMIDVVWDVTDAILDAGGVKTLSLTVTIDPNDTFSELDETNNEQSKQMSVDLRPRIDASAVHTEYLPGVFVSGVDLPADFVIDDIDWNGNLPGTDLAGSVARTVELVAGTLRKEILIFGSPSPPFEFTIDLGEELPVGTSDLRLQAKSFGTIQSLPISYDYTRINNNPEWIGDSVVTVSDDGEGPFDKVAVYHAGFSFPELATKGFFELPVTAHVGAGLLGPEIGPYQLALDLRSDGAATLTGSGPWSGKVAGRQIFPEVDVEISGTAASDGTELRLTELSTTVTRGGSLETPKIPLPPPVSFLSAHGELSGEVSATLKAVEGADGLEFAPAGFGLSVGAGLFLSAGYEGIAYAQGGVGGNIAASFLLPGDPCLLDEVTLQFSLSAQVQFLIFTKNFEFNFPDPPITLIGCGPAGSSEPQNLLALSEGEPPPVTIAPSTAGPHYLTLGDGGLPDIRYAFATPAIAHHDAGSKTLVWVDEDPSKPIEGRLEIVASRFVDGVWTTPVAITNDSLLDFQPTVTALDDGRAIAVWSHVNDAADKDNPDPTELLDSLDLMFSVFDPAIGTWSAPELLLDSGMDYLPQVVASGSGGATVAYLNDVDGSTFLFPEDTAMIDSRVMVRQFDGTSWSNPEEILVNVETATAPQIVAGDLGDNVTAMIVLSKPLLGDSNGLRAAVLRNEIWSAETFFAGNPSPQSPTVTSLPTGGAAIAWVDPQVVTGPNPEDTADQIVFATFDNGALGTPQTIHQAEGISEPVIYADDSGMIAIVWVESFADGVDVGYIVRDEAGKFGEPQRIQSATEQIPWWLLTWLEGDSLKVLNIARDVTRAPAAGSGSGESTSGMLPRLINPTLGLSEAIVAPDLAVSPISIAGTIGAGETVNLTTTIRNLGDRTSPATDAILEIDGMQVGTAQAIPTLDPGASTVVQFTVALPLTLVAHELKLRADPENDIAERNEANNIAIEQLFHPDLRVDTVRANLDADQVTVDAIVRSVGLIGTTSTVTAELSIETTTGRLVLGTIEVPALAPGESMPIQFVVDDALATLEQARLATITIDSASGIPESNEANNRSAVFLNPFNSWTNRDNPLDIDGNSRVEPLDALLVINLLNRVGAHRLPFPPTPKPFFDADRDGSLFPLDALLVINELNRIAAGGEPSSSNVDSAPKLLEPPHGTAFYPSPTEIYFSHLDDDESETRNRELEDFVLTYGASK